AARRMQCSSNIKQLSLAVLNYESTHHVLPAAGICDIVDSTFDCQSNTMFSWVVLILPFMEQTALHDRFDFRVSVRNQDGNPQAEQPPILLCPSDGARGRLFIDATLTAGRPFGKGNYAAYCSILHIDDQESPPGKWPYAFPGAIVGHGQATSSITDGLSTTLMLAEVRTRDQQQDQRGAWALPWAGSSLLSVDRHAQALSHYVPDNYTRGMAQTPNCQGPIYDMIYHCVDPAGAQWEHMPCATWAPGYPNGFLSAATRSLHPGGVNVSFVDGHVMFMQNDIDEIVMAYMACVNDGQIINLDDLSL
ncbi:MAG: DUF1559 domain-containing protein, partial [Pirellulales bacterium]|nr:DUF1559 domain-containing protein [Pirellulales bacterium]